MRLPTWIKGGIIGSVPFVIAFVWGMYGLYTAQDPFGPVLFLVMAAWFLLPLILLGMIIGFLVSKWPVFSSRVKKTIIWIVSILIVGLISWVIYLSYLPGLDSETVLTFLLKLVFPSVILCLIIWFIAYKIQKSKESSTKK